MEEKIKTVAIFMGLFQDDKGFWGFKNTPERQRCHSDRIKDIYQYDRDWNLLMKVVEKIEKEFCSTNIHYYSQKQMYSVDFSGFNIKYEESEYGNNKLKILYDSCVKFINFYNKRKEE